MEIHRNNAIKDYTEEFVENKRNDILSHNRKRVKAILRALYNHCTNPELGILVPEQIKFMIRNILEAAFMFEQESLEIFNELSEEDKIKLEANFLSSKDLEYMSSHTVNSAKGTPKDTVESFYKKQEEIDKEIRKKALEYLEQS